MRVIRKKRAILLIMTLIILAIIMMFVGAGLSLSQSSGALAVFQTNDQKAREAAQAGIAYARNRLQENPTWHGGDSNQIVVNMPGQLWVREDHGNVFGIVGSGDQQAVFRIRFNYQNGPKPAGDGLDDPSLPDMKFKIPYVSENNLDSANSKPVYRASQRGWSVEPNTSFSPNDCPRYSTMILCEGLAGDGIRNISPVNLKLDSEYSKIHRQVAEVVIGRNLNQIGDSPIYGGDDITMNLHESPKIKVRSSDNQVPARMRTMQNIKLNNTGVKPDLDMTNKGEAFVKEQNGTMTLNGDPSTAPKATQEDSSAKFPRISWSQVAKAAPTATNVDAGTYVWRDNPRRLDYYAQPYDNTAGPPDSTVTPNKVYTSSSQLAPGTIALDKTTFTMNITQDVYVKPVGLATGIAVVPDKDLLNQTKKRPEITLTKANSNAKAPILTAGGDVFFQGSLTGQGSVTSEHNISFQGTSVLEADPNSRTAIYAQGNITLNEIPPQVTPPPTVAQGSGGIGRGSGSGSGSAQNAIPTFLSSMQVPPFGTPTYQDIAFAGMVYSQANITVNFPTQNTDLYFLGMVVAYGANPDSTDLPGKNGGKIDFDARNVYLEYNSRYIIDQQNLSNATSLEISSYNFL